MFKEIEQSSGNQTKLRKPFPLQFMHRRPSLPIRRPSIVEQNSLVGGSPEAQIQQEP